MIPERALELALAVMSSGVHHLELFWQVLYHDSYFVIGHTAAIHYMWVVPDRTLKVGSQDDEFGLFLHMLSGC